MAASLVEVRDGVVYLKSKDGKTIKVEVSKLSKKDQEYLEGGASPFEMVESDDSPTKTGSSATKTGASGSAGSEVGEYDWASPVTVDWDAADEFQSMAGVEWKVPLRESNGLGFEPKRAALAKKSTFHEAMHRLGINPLCKRAAVGYTVSFAVPKPLSRLSVVDLVEGKAVNSEQVEANMRPLTVLSDGVSVLMVGASDERGGYEMGDQLQVWRLSGKKIVRSASWTPYVMEKEDWGKKANAAVVDATVVRDNLVLTVSEKGHLVSLEPARTYARVACSVKRQFRRCALHGR